MSKLKIEIAKNVTAGSDQKKMQNAFKFSSHAKPMGGNDISESIGEEKFSDTFERDENASSMNISSSLMFGKKEASFKLSDSRKSKGKTAIHEDLLVCREATDEQEELSDEDFLTEKPREGDKSTSKLDDSILNYSADTMTIGGNSSLAFSGNQGFFQNNL